MNGKGTGWREYDEDQERERERVWGSIKKKINSENEL